MDALISTARAIAQHAHIISTQVFSAHAHIKRQKNTKILNLTKKSASPSHPNIQQKSTINLHAQHMCEAYRALLSI